jgi:predicted murein hydrolase (TIGR00659 family)
MTRQEFLALWMPLGPSPLLWLAATLGAYAVARKLQRLGGGMPYANPVLLAIIIVATLVLATGTSYQTYFAGAQFINFLLGPATVALAVPLARNLRHVRRSLRGVGLALLAGSMTSIISGAGLVWLLGGSRLVAFSMAPKAVTTPIAMAVSQQIGGVPPLTAAFAILGGIVAASFGQRLLKQFKIDDWRAHGLAAGVAGSGIAAAQVAPLNGLAAAFAALGIALNGILTALILPFLALLWP